MNRPLEAIKPYGTDAGSKHEQVGAMFDAIATDYDRLNHTMALGIDNYWRRRAIRTLLHRHPRRILDVATGTGDFALLACRILQPERITGIDISEGMMRVGRDKVAQANLADKVAFVHGDCTALSFDNDTFDAVTVAFGVRNFEDIDKGLAEICRVLKPGGSFVMLELSTPDRFPMRPLFALYSKTVIPLLGRCMSDDNSAYTYLPQSIRAFPQGEVMRQTIGQAGFSRVDFRRLTFGICTLYEAIK
ncbi:MAG: bifunctional demethylmenaquinone methyltransferase/2-methoxy-6-polyprenyl-1,4-benzoquinol methylase UbiE [Prevotellaceae bacterium]|jgi:demethylmenaquinone methyltransferase/2-methoxy-6-polyprenyl-1,4-benzoquinol methylase|nr:bifunctional demethylmenaquinone methyltransferase/2-methoxy-6-polyprenyl-1,4-benzoquinol methylase UbiE [Prevotellaceae bacterium]